MYKVIVSQKKESTLNYWNESFLKPIPSRFMLTSTWNISILIPTCSMCWSFLLVWMKMQIHSLPLGATFGALKISVSAVTLYTKQHCAHKHCFIRHYRRMKMKSTNHSRLVSRKGGVWKNESLSESFGSRWASKNKCIL